MDANDQHGTEPTWHRFIIIHILMTLIRDFCVYLRLLWIQGFIKISGKWLQLIDIHYIIIYKAKHLLYTFPFSQLDTTIKIFLCTIYTYPFKLSRFGRVNYLKGISGDKLFLLECPNVFKNQIQRWVSRGYLFTSIMTCYLLDVCFLKITDKLGMFCLIIVCMSWQIALKFCLVFVHWFL